MTSNLLTKADARPSPLRGSGRLPWAIAWAILGAGAAALLWVLIQDVWPKRPEMGDRFLVPIASVVIVRCLLPRWRTTPIAPQRIALIGVALSAVAFPLAWHLMIRVGPRTLLLWWLYGALVIGALSLLTASFGWFRARLMVFPCLFTFFALPMPDAIQSWILPSLKSFTAAGATAVLPWLGVPAVRAGYTISLPSGKLNVVDACSGALSLVSLLAIAVLTAYIRLTFRRDLGITRGLVLVLLTLPIVVISNTVRVILTGVLQHYVGEWAILGIWHEVLGYLVILVGFGLIVGTSQKLSQKLDESEESAKPLEESAEPSVRCGWGAALMLIPALAACIWTGQLRTPATQVLDLNELPRQYPGWTAMDLPVSAEVAEMLKCDQLILREYENHLGKRVQVYFMFWATPASTAHIHHPDVCWPARGCVLHESRVQPVRYSKDRRPLEVSARHYENELGQREIVYYWTQNGNSVLPDGRELPEHTSEYGWIAEMFSGRQPPARVSRISVLLATDVPVGKPSDEEERLKSLSALIAADLYRICSWADPAK